jgi:choline dehydrogenase-like flavoprotein
MIRDPIRAGLASGWKVTDASALERDLALEADVAIIGTGAGGGVTAEILAAAGLDVALIEEGPLRSSSDFRMLEAEAYPQLYQESAARKTLDKAITILQGRAVGGSTTVNWTSSFRTPETTLAYWRERFGLGALTAPALAPWFERMERRLAIAPWTVPANENNDLLRRGGAKLGIATAAIRRNVSGCANLGYCGMGCPTNAKQSMLVTTIRRRSIEARASFAWRGPTACASGAGASRRSSAALWTRAACIRPGGASRCVRATMSSRPAASALRRCSCAAGRRTRTACSASAPSCTRR